jgi:hypothetical protein
MKRHLQPVTARANARIRKSGNCGCGSPSKKMKDLSGDGKITQKDVLMGRGVIPSPSKQTEYEKALGQKHSVKVKTTTQGDKDNVKRSTRSEVTNIESKSNRRTQKISGNSSGDKKGSTATLTTVKDPNNPGSRLVVGPEGGHHQMGTEIAQQQLKNFQRTYNKTKNK